MREINSRRDCKVRDSRTLKHLFSPWTPAAEGGVKWVVLRDYVARGPRDPRALPQIRNSSQRMQPLSPVVPLFSAQVNPAGPCAGGCFLNPISMKS